MVDDEQAAIESELDLDPPSGQAASAMGRWQLEDRALDPDGVVVADDTPPAEGADALELRDRWRGSPGRDGNARGHREAGVEPADEAFELGVGLTLAAGRVQTGVTAKTMVFVQTNNGGTAGSGDVVIGINAETALARHLRAPGALLCRSR